jgi:hypothetical protein
MNHRQNQLTSSSSAINNEFSNPYNIYSNHINSSQNEEFNTLAGAQHMIDQNRFINEQQRSIRSIPAIRQQSNFNEFDNYSQVVTEDDNYSLSGKSIVINYGDIDVQKDSHSIVLAKQMNNNDFESFEVHPNTSNSYPYTLKTNTNLGSIITTSNGMSYINNESLYRAVEYTKSPRLERVRVKTCEDSDDAYESTLKIDEFSFCRNGCKIESCCPGCCCNGEAVILSDHNTFNNTSDLSSIYREETSRENEMTSSSYHHNHNHHFCNDQYECEEGEKKFVVKLYPFDEQEKEVQEMSMYVTNDVNAPTRSIDTYKNYSPNIFY